MAAELVKKRPHQKIRIITSLDGASLDMLEKEKGGNYFSFEDSDFRRRHLAE